MTKTPLAPDPPRVFWTVWYRTSKYPIWTPKFGGWSEASARAAAERIKDGEWVITSGRDIPGPDTPPMGGRVQLRIID